MFNTTFSDEIDKLALEIKKSIERISTQELEISTQKEKNKALLWKIETLFKMSEDRRLEILKLAHQIESKKLNRKQIVQTLRDLAEDLDFNI